MNPFKEAQKARKLQKVLDQCSSLLKQDKLGHHRAVMHYQKELGVSPEAARRAVATLK